MRGEVIDSINNWWVDSSCSWAAHHNTTAPQLAKTDQPPGTMSSGSEQWAGAGASTQLFQANNYRLRLFMASDNTWRCLQWLILFCWNSKLAKDTILQPMGECNALTHSCPALPASSSSKKNRKVLCAPVHYINLTERTTAARERDTWHVVTSGDRTRQCQVDSARESCSFTQLVLLLPC